MLAARISEMREAPCLYLMVVDTVVTEGVRWTVSAGVGWNEREGRGAACRSGVLGG